MVTIIAWTRNFLIIIVVNKRLDSWKRKATLLELLQCYQLKIPQISTIEQASIEICKFLTKLVTLTFVQCNRTRIAIATTASKAGCNGGADFGLYTKFLEVL